MLFSIVTVCYNSEKTIETTIKSILNQTCQDYEYWIIDGKSTDRTVQIIQQYEPLFQGKLKWISEKDQGIYDAMNKGIAHSSGEIIGILNSDDYYEDDALEKIAKAYHGAILYCIRNDPNHARRERSYGIPEESRISRRRHDCPSCMFYY